MDRALEDVKVLDLTHVQAGPSCGQMLGFLGADVVKIEDTRGGDSNGVTVHSARMPGRMAHHELVFGTLGQTLTIRHDSINRESFMPGVMMAVREVVKRPGLTVGLDKVMGL